MNMNDFESLEEIVLLVDDNYNNIELLKKILEKDGYEIAFALSGEQALQMAPKLRPNIILLDIMMPGIDGFETCGKLKENEMTRDIPVIFISAKSRPEDIARGFEVGGMDYITKPFNINEVLARVRTHLHLKKLMEQKEKCEEKAKAYAQQLEISNQELKDFISIASHDLHAPLRKIVLFGGYLEEQAESFGEKEKTYFDKIKKSAVRMQGFLDDILKLSRVTTQSKPLERVDLNEIVAQVLEDLEGSILETNGVVEVGELPIIDGDEFQIRQLFQNLISNSLKFHREGVSPLIKIAGSLERNDIWTIVVEDNGIGFDQKFENRIFKPFERLHGQSEFEGTGMGLAICQKIAARHCGNITVKSRVGKGSVFTIELPQSMPASKMISRAL